MARDKCNINEAISTFTRHVTNNDDKKEKKCVISFLFFNHKKNMKVMTKMEVYIYIYILV
jgi:hypothetical protein